MTTVLFVDTEAAVRTWLRGHPLLVDLVGMRVFFGLPDNYLPAEKGAAVTVQRIGGAPDGYDSSDTPDLQFSCWGGTKAEAAALHLALMRALEQLGRVAVGDTLLLGARVTSALFSPDSSAAPTIPRYIVTALLTATSSEGAAPTPTSSGGYSAGY